MEIHDYILLGLIVIAYGWNRYNIMYLQRTAQASLDTIAKTINKLFDEKTSTNKKLEDHLEWHGKQRERIIPLIKDIEIDKEMKRGKRR